MAAVQWSYLPEGILYIIAKFLDTDFDLLRVRSVCSPWRSSLSPPPRKPFSFPVKVPSFPPYFPSLFGDREKAHYTLHESTLFRLSPPEDPTNGWMFKVSETNPNVFILLKPVSAETDYKMPYPPGTIPNHLNLLNYRISEISKSYNLFRVDRESLRTGAHGRGLVRKVIALFGYVVDCDFAALALHHDGSVDYWKFGDKRWTPVHTNGQKFRDIILCDGKVYAIDKQGVLVFLDFKLQLTKVASSPGNDPEERNRYFLVKCDTDLYAASKVYGSGPEFFIEGEETSCGFAVTLRKFNKYKGNWDYVGDLGDKVFLLGKDESVGVSVKDFKGCKGNCVYLIDDSYFEDSEHDLREVYGNGVGIYHLDRNRRIRMTMDEESRKLYWPPPSWLMPTASSSEP